MRPSPAPRTPPAHYDDLPPDLSFDEPPSADFAVDVFPDVSADALPEALDEAPPRSKKVSRVKGYASRAEPAPPPARLEQPASVCLSCGASPPEGGDCPHDEIAHLADASPAVMAVVRKLQAAVQERHAQERALRRLVAVEVSSGRGDLETPRRPDAQGPVEREPHACARCGHRPTTSRAARRKALAEAQATFAFAAPPPVEAPAPPPMERAEPAVAAPEAGPQAPSPRPKRGRPRKAAETAIAPENTGLQGPATT